AIVLINSKSYEVKINEPLKFFRPSFTAVILSKSKWLVGSSNNTTLEFDNIILLNIHLTFSPPESTSAFFLTSSPLNRIRPQTALNYLTVCPSGGGYCLNQAPKFIFTPSKNSELSLGK